MSILCTVYNEDCLKSHNSNSIHHTHTHNSTFSHFHAHNTHSVTYKRTHTSINWQKADGVEVKLLQTIYIQGVHKIYSEQRRKYSKMQNDLRKFTLDSFALEYAYKRELTTGAFTQIYIYVREYVLHIHIGI